MSSTSIAGGGATGPALGVSFEGRPRALLEAVAPLVDVVEVVPDCLVGHDGKVNPRLLDDLDELAGGTDLTYHGIGLSLGSTGGWNEDYLRLLDTFLDWRTPRWHSEHLGFCLVDGSFLGTMPALPATHEALELVVDRATEMRRRYGLEFLLEHVASPLERPSEMSLASFLNTIAEETGSRLLLDLHNLECDVDNGQLDLDDFVDELEWSHVGEIHLAGGVWHQGYHLDVHSGLVAPSTSRRLDVALERADRLELVLFEVLAEAVPVLGVEAVAGQLRDVRTQLDEASLPARLDVASGAPA